MKRILWSGWMAVGLMMAVAGETYTIDSYVIAGGGGTSSGGAYTVSGTIGQLSAGPALTGGGYTLQGGFWPGLVVTSDGEIPQLFIQISEQNVIVSWAPATSGFVLEQASGVDAEAWLEAPMGNPVVLPTLDAAVFYRLRKN